MAQDNQAALTTPSTAAQLPASPALTAGPGLPPDQQQVLELLVAGKSVAVSAREASVGRTTIYKWLKSDPAFISAYAQWKEEMQTSAASRMLALMDTAADALEKTLKAGDGRLGLAVLDKMGATRNKTLMNEEAKEIMRKRRIAEAPKPFTEQVSEFTRNFVPPPRKLEEKGK